MKILHNPFTYIVSKTHVEFCEYELFYLLYHNLVILFFIFHGHTQLWITPQRSKLSPNSIQWLLRYRLKTSVCIYKSQAQEIIPQDQCKHHQKLLLSSRWKFLPLTKARLMCYTHSNRAGMLKSQGEVSLIICPLEQKSKCFKTRNLRICTQFAQMYLLGLFIHFFSIFIHKSTAIPMLYIHTHIYIYTHILKYFVCIYIHMYVYIVVPCSIRKLQLLEVTQK